MYRQCVPMLLMVVAASLRAPGASGLYSSVKTYTTTIPISIGVHEHILDLYIHQEATSSSFGQSVKLIECAVIQTLRDDTLISSQDSPFAINPTDLYIYTRQPIQSLLHLDANEIKSFNLSIRCSCTQNSTLMTSAIINVTTTARWQDNQCHSHLTNEDINNICFADDLTNFTIEENVVGRLGRVARYAYLLACPGFDMFQLQYNSISDTIKVEDGELVLMSPFDAEDTGIIHTSVTCSMSMMTEKSVTYRASRGISVYVRDVNDCGPTLMTSSGLVKVIYRTLTADKETRLVFRDDDANPGVNQYFIQTFSDPEHILSFSQPTRYATVYVFSLRATRIPEHDLNASVVITDESIVSDELKDRSAICYIFVKGLKSSTNVPYDSSETVVKIQTTRPSVGTSTSKGMSPFSGMSNFPMKDITYNTDYSMDESSYNEYTDTYDTDSDDQSDTSITDDVKQTSEMSEVDHITDSHVPLETGHMTRTGFSSSSEFSVNTQQNNYLTRNIRVSASATKYSRVAEDLLQERAGIGSFQIAKTSDIPFSISKYRGVVYTTDELTDYAHKNMTLEIVGYSSATFFNDDLHVKLNIIVQPSTLTLESCDNSSCSSAQNESQCVVRCGYGAPSGRCIWRPFGGGIHYSTCVPSSRTCPDKECDDDLESEISELCPQDCARSVMIDGHLVDIDHLNNTAPWICYCTSAQNCTCIPDPPPTVLPTDAHIPDRCDTKCTVVITISMIGSVTIFVIILVFCRYRTTSKSSMKHVSSLVSISAIPSDYVDDHDRHSGLIPSIDWSPKLVDAHFKTDPKWEIPRANVRLDKIIGEGEFGRVVRGQVLNLRKQKGYTMVAIKMLKECASTAEFRDLLSEYNLLKDVVHRNVIKLLGVCSLKGPFFLIVEYCEHGSLRTYLRKSRHIGSYISRDVNDDIAINDDMDTKKYSIDIVITAKDCLSFAWQTANGMSYLSDMKLCHRDLAARNLLVSSGKIIKISDFGLTRDIYEGDAYMKRSKGRIPVKWMAPESLYDQIYTSKSDVWSFGIVLWEIITLGATPYPGVPPERLYQLLKTGYRMDKPQGCSAELFSMMQQCWSEDSSRRSPFKQLALQLEDMLKENIAYLDLTYQSDRTLIEDDVTDTTDDDTTGADLKDSENQNEPEYGRINILNTDNNSYVLTPSLHLNGEPMFRHWPRDGHCSSWSHDHGNSSDVENEETHFLQNITPPEAGAGTSSCVDRQDILTEQQGLVCENMV